MKTTLEILKEARELIAKEGAWSQAHGFSNSDQTCFCAHGAINKVATGDAESCLEAEVPAVAAFASVVVAEGDDFGIGHIWDFNDAPGRTQAEVVAKFDEAIALEEAKAS